MLENFSEAALKAVMYAQEEARRLRHPLVLPDHLLLGLLRDSDTAASEVLKSKGIEPVQVRARVHLELGERRAGMEIAYADETQLVFRLAEAEARSLNLPQVDTDHLLLGLVEAGEGQTHQVLSQAGLNFNHLRWNTLRMRFTKRNAAFRTAMLDRYSLDLTGRLERGEQATVVEWEPMVERLIQYLGLHQKHQVLLVGEHGVGKTALIHALNQYILDSRITQPFAHCRVVFLYIDKMLAEAGTTDEQLYDVTHSIMQEVRQSGDIILVIENIHQLFLARKKELEFIITQQLLTLLEESAIHCIATTTPHFLKHLENETIIHHLFQVLEVPEPPQPFCVHILKHWQERLEAHHQLELSPEALELAVKLAGDHAPQKRPEAALTLLDLAASRKRWQHTTDRQALRRTERSLHQLVEQRALLATSVDESPAAHKAFEQVKQELLRHEIQLERLQQRLQQEVVRLEGEDVLAAAQHPARQQ